MRLSFYHLLLVIFSITISVSCQQAEQFDTPQKVELTLNAHIGQTRSGFGELSGNAYPSVWSGKETFSALLEDGWNDYYSYSTYTNNGQKGSTANLKFSFNAPLPESGFLYICSPSESISIVNSSFKVNVPTEQTPETYSVDPKAHILKAEIPNAIPGEEIDVTFEHAVSYGRMTLTNLSLPSGAMIDYVELTLGSKTYTLHADNVVKKVFWFACDNKGTVNNMSITVVDTNKRKYTKSASRSIEFDHGEITQFTINMNGISGWADNEVKPLEKPNNIVVAHRGAYKAYSGNGAVPHNSLASLRRAISLGCYGSECDIYWTKDNNVVVVHANSETCKINDLYPWESTVAQIQASKKLSNGETIPTLQDYLEVLIKESKCTKLVLDIKNITEVVTTVNAQTRASYCIKACKRAIEIIQQMGAQEYVEFICTGNSTVMTGCAPLCEAAKIEIGWMANESASTYKSKGTNYNYAYHWANLSLEYMNDGIIYDGYTTEQGKRTIDEFVNKGIAISVYNVDTEEQMTYYVKNAGKLKCICTNYPKTLLNKMGK